MARYQKIHSQIWQDEKFITLSQDAKYLFLYILTSPHSNSIGLYVLPKQYILADLEWDMKRLAKPFKELLDKEIILYDETVKIICIKNQLKHNPLENENQTKSIAKIISTLPKSSIYSNILEQLSKRFHEPLREQLAKLIPQPETETETETETEEENIRARATPPPKQKYLDSVFLTADEYDRLKEAMGQKSLDRLIEQLDYSITVKSGHYKDHNKTLLNWFKRGYHNNGNGRHAEYSGGRVPEEPDMIDRALRGEI